MIANQLLTSTNLNANDDQPQKQQQQQDQETKHGGVDPSKKGDEGDDGENHPKIHYADYSDAADGNSQDGNSKEKGHTFRKRRLTCPKHHLEAAAAAAAAAFADDMSDDDDDGGNDNASKIVKTGGAASMSISAAAALAAEFDDEDDNEDGDMNKVDKRKSDNKNINSTSITGDFTSSPAAFDDDFDDSDCDDTANEPALKKQKLEPIREDKEENGGLVDGSTNKKVLKSRVVHAGELVRHHPIIMSSPSVVPRLYQPPFAPPTPSVADAAGVKHDQTGERQLQQQQHEHVDHHDHADADHHPKWKKRHSVKPHEHEDKLPFPRNIVGTYSCHGIEPIYDDSEYQPTDDDNDDENDDPDFEPKEDDDGGGHEQTPTEEEEQQKIDCDIVDADGAQEKETTNDNNENSNKNLQSNGASNSNDALTSHEVRQDQKRDDKDEELVRLQPNNNNDETIESHANDFEDHNNNNNNNNIIVHPTLSAKINQDRAGIATPYGNCSRSALFAVYDGHGQGGEQVSQYALHEIHHRLEKHPNFTSDIEKAFKDTFQQVDFDLTKEDLIEPLYAGTTACVALVRNNQITVANAGDSRAVLARKVIIQSNGEEANNAAATSTWEASDLTLDHNPDLPEEQNRIEEAGGFVSPPPEEGLSARVWLDESFSMIGLAMSRSIGDHAVKTVGVIAEPAVSTHDICEDDDFMIIASDGVWEFITSQEAVDIVSEHINHKETDRATGDNTSCCAGGATKACQKLIEAAAAKWHEEEGDYRDDITAVVVRLQELWKKSDDNNDAIYR